MIIYIVLISFSLIKVTNVINHRHFTDHIDFSTDTISESESHSVVSDSLRPHGLYSPWNSPGQNAIVGNLSLLQQIFPTQGSNSSFPYCRRMLYKLSHKGSTDMIMLSENTAIPLHLKHVCLHIYSLPYYIGQNSCLMLRRSGECGHTLILNLK